MKIANMLSPTTDVEALVKRSFVSLDGVTDEWLKSLQVEKIAGGQVSRSWILAAYARYNPNEFFCGPCVLPVVQ